MKKIPPLLEELFIWVRGRFSLTNEEKLWLLIVLVILWVGLLGRYIHLKSQKPELLTPQQMEELLSSYPLGDSKGFQYASPVEI